MLNRLKLTDQFNFVRTDRFANRGGDQSTILRENTFISDEVERKRWLEEEFARIETNERQKYDEQLARQAELNRETVRMIKELDEYDKARKMRRDMNNKTEIQGLSSAPHQHNYENRIQLNDDNLYEANVLPYKQGSLSLGIWRGGSPSQYVTFASDSPQPKGKADVLTGEGSYMIDVFQNHGNHQYTAGSTVAPGVAIDNIEEYGKYIWEETERNREKIDRLADEAEYHAKEIMGNFFFDLAIKGLNIVFPERKMTIEGSVFIYSVCQCLIKAYEDEVNLYMQEYNCSYDEAKEMVRPGIRFVKNFWSMMMGDWLNEALDRLGIPMVYRKAIIHTVHELIQDKTK